MRCFFPSSLTPFPIQRYNPGRRVWVWIWLEVPSTGEPGIVNPTENQTKKETDLWCIGWRGKPSMCPVPLSAKLGFPVASPSPSSSLTSNTNQAQALEKHLYTHTTILPTTFGVTRLPCILGCGEPFSLLLSSEVSKIKLITVIVSRDES